MDVQASEEDSPVVGSDSEVDFIFRVPATGNLFASHHAFQPEAVVEAEAVEACHLDDSVAETYESLGLLASLGADNEHYVPIVLQVGLEHHHLVAVVGSE